MDLPSSHSGVEQFAGDGGGQPRRPAQVDVVLDQAGHPPGQLTGGQRVPVKFGAAARDEPDLRATAIGELLELFAEHRVAQLLTR